MAEEDEDSAEYDEIVVRVKAQVMTRGDFGWKPRDGGGMSNVCMHKRQTQNSEDPVQEYFIQGIRISDEVILLECLLTANVEYERADPTFHHWSLDGKKYGLTFPTNGEARAFSQGVKDAVHDLSKGVPRENFSLDIGEDEVYRVGRKTSFPVSVHSSSISQASLPPSTSSSLSPFTSPPCSTAGSSRQCSPSRTVQSLSHYSDFSDFHKIVYDVRQVPNNSHGQQPLAVKVRGSKSKSRQSTLSYANSKFKVDRRPIVVYSSQKPVVDARQPVIKDSWDSIGPYVHFERKDPPTPIPPPQHHSVAASRSSQLNATTASHSRIYSYPSLEGMSLRGNSSTSRHETPIVYNFKSTRQSRSNSEPQIAVARCTTPPLPTRRVSNTRRQRFCLGGGDDDQTTGNRRGSSGEGERTLTLPRKRRCVVCEEYYWLKDNKPGSCKDGRDRVRDGIACLTCLCCANCLLYCCAHDSEGDYPEPCTCGGVGESGDDDNDCDRGRERRTSGRRSANCRQWTLLAVLSIFLPCLWCYWPLSRCHRACVSRGLCGPRHRAADSDT